MRRLEVLLVFVDFINFHEVIFVLGFLDQALQLIDVSLKFLHVEHTEALRVAELYIPQLVEHLLQVLQTWSRQHRRTNVVQNLA